MNTHDEDRGLRERFASLRREEESGATSFERVLEGRPPAAQPRRRMAVPAFAGIVLLAGLALVVGQVWQLRRGVAPGETALPLASWSEPTAFLLRTPGSDLLSTVPAFARETPAVGPDAPPGALPPFPQPAPTQRSPSS